MDNIHHDFASAGGPLVTRGVVMVTPDGHEYVRVDHPAALARFISFVKHRAARFGADVFFRGQREDVRDMRPCLYRGVDSTTASRRREAYLELVERLPKELQVSRFDSLNSGAVLQHYGINTPWLDVVDNLYTALWFAIHQPREDAGKVRYLRRSHGEGWIILLANKRPGLPDLHVADLRVTQASLSTRLHMQHGVTLATSADYEPTTGELSLEGYVIGRACFPISALWNVRGWLYSQAFMFPPATVDHTYRILRRRQTQTVVSTVEANHCVVGALGAVTRYAYRPLKFA